MRTNEEKKRLSTNEVLEAILTPPASPRISHSTQSSFSSSLDPKGKEECSASHSSSATTSLLSPRCFKQLVFEGGGVKGIAYVGALEVLEERGYLRQVEHVAGTSAGSITALLLALGYDVQAIKALLAMDFTQFKDGSWSKTKNIYDLTNAYGVHPGNSFYTWEMERIKTATGNPYTTFEELHRLCLARKPAERHYREFSVVGVNLSKGIYTIFSYQTTPKVTLADAVRISMSIPVFFQPVLAEKTEHGDFLVDPNTHQLLKTNSSDFYVDGGLLNNFALKLFDQDGKPNPTTLGLRVDSAAEIAQLRDGREPTSQPLPNLVSYLTAVVNTSMSGQNYVQLSHDDQQRTIYIDTLDVGTVEFDLSKEKINRLIQSGREATELYLQQKAYQPLSSAVQAERLARYEQKQLYRKAVQIYGNPLSGAAFEGQASGSFMQLLFTPENKTTAEKGMQRLVSHPGIETVRLAEYHDKQTMLWVLQVTGKPQLWQSCKHYLDKYQLTKKCIDKALPPHRLATIAEWTTTPSVHTQRLGRLRQLDKQLLEAAYQGNLAQVEQCLQEGARYDYREPRSGDTPLHRAAESGQGKVVACLLQYGAFVDSRNLLGNTPLLLAAFEGQTVTMGQLIAKGADIESMNHFGARPLHRAARMGWQEAIDLLLKHGANPAAKDYDEFTPAEVAQRYGKFVVLPQPALTTALSPPDVLSTTEQSSSLRIS